MLQKFKLARGFEVYHVSHARNVISVIKHQTAAFSCLGFFVEKSFSLLSVFFVQSTVAFRVIWEKKNPPQTMNSPRKTKVIANKCPRREYKKSEFAFPRGFQRMRNVERAKYLRISVLLLKLNNTLEN